MWQKPTEFIKKNPITVTRGHGPREKELTQSLALSASWYFKWSTCRGRMLHANL